MFFKAQRGLFAVSMVLSACVSPDVVVTDLGIGDLPAEVRAAAEAVQAGFTPSAAQRKVRDGRTYYDVEGSLPDGSEIEFDILMTDEGPEVVEIQRDIDWASVPLAVRSAAIGGSLSFVPARVIESRQPDGSIIFELFAPDAPADPAMEISLIDAKATVLSRRWKH